MTISINIFKDTPSRLTVRMALLTGLAALLFSCGGSEPPAPATPAPIAYPQPKPGQEAYSLLKQDGTLWANQQGEKVSLRGINLGNWLAMEMWMFDQGDNPLGEGIIDQCTLEATLTERFSPEEKDRLLTVFRDSWMQSEDWDLIADSGFNLIRLPFFYDLIENDSQPMTLRENAWHYIDKTIEEAKARNMYVILDLHGAVGRQSDEHHTGCSNQNMFWSSQAYQNRTAWLWEQIAQRYKDEPAIAGYGLLNEPWGTDAITLRDVMVDLYQAVRKHDQSHIVILPGHNSDGIRAYGDPSDLGMENVAFEIHQYPGLFGWGEIGYQVHRDWLTCGKDQTGGVCSWAKQAREVYTPLLVGETQTWTSLGDLGGPITRASFDRYNDLNWAVTAWSYKTVSASGGLGNGQWGLVTNNGEQLLTKAETWSCNDWESTFANACAVPARSTTPLAGEGSKTFYLVIKTGAFNGSDVIYDSLALVKDSTGENIISNGEFGSGEGWTEVAVWGDPRTYDFNYAAGEFAGGDSGPALRITSEKGNNSLIYQAVSIEGGESYTLSGKFKDLGDGGNDMWAEVYLVPDMPQEWVDVTGRALPPVNINESSIEEIENFFSAFADMDYVQNAWVISSLTQDEPANIFTDIPGVPTNFDIAVSDEQVTLTWSASSGNVTEYKVFRSTQRGAGFAEIGTTTNTRYEDSDRDKEITYYYNVVAANDTDQSFPTETLASGKSFFAVPTRIQAENFSASHPGVEVETAGDEGGGFNIGHFEVDRWVEYEVKVETAGTYTFGFRLATLPGSDGFEVIRKTSEGETVLDTIAVPSTGGWQDYVTIESDIDLEEGEWILRLRSISNQWNLNWIDISSP